MNYQNEHPVHVKEKKTQDVGQATKKKKSVSISLFFRLSEHQVTLKNWQLTSTQPVYLPPQKSVQLTTSQPLVWVSHASRLWYSPAGEPRTG